MACAIMERSEMTAQDRQRGRLSVLKRLVRCISTSHTILNSTNKGVRNKTNHNINCVVSVIFVTLYGLLPSE